MVRFISTLMLIMLLIMSAMGILASPAAAQNEDGFRFVVFPKVEKGKIFMIPEPSGAYFFKDKANFDRYLIDKNSLKNLSKGQDYFALDRGHGLMALESFEGSHGQVHDKQLGAGYVLMFTF